MKQAIISTSLISNRTPKLLHFNLGYVIAVPSSVGMLVFTNLIKLDQTCSNMFKLVYTLYVERLFIQNC